MAEASIEVTNLSKRFKLYTERRSTLKERFVRRSGSSHEDFWALRDISFEVSAGSTFGLIGHNGSGKSTLLKLLAGIHRPTSGSIAARGRISALLELGAGFHSELTGRENIYLNGAILGLTRKQIDSSMDEIIDFAGIPDFIDSPVKVYSSGMFVRLGFAIAVTVDPEILLVDEIIAVGDEEFQRKCLDHVFELRRRGTTIVLVTHSLQMVTELCDHGVWLDHGVQRAFGDMREVADSYLVAVNEKEESDNKAAHPHTEPRPEGGATRGSGQIRIDSVEYLDGDGETSSFATAGEPITFRMNYTATEAIPHAVFGLEFVHESGVHVAAPNSATTDQIFTIAGGGGHIDFRVDRLLLQPGAYRLTAAISDRGHVYDLHDRRFEFRVRPGPGGAEPGLIRIIGEWTDHHS